MQQFHNSLRVTGVVQWILDPALRLAAIIGDNTAHDTLLGAIPTKVEEAQHFVPISFG